MKAQKPSARRALGHIFVVCGTFSGAAMGIRRYLAAANLAAAARASSDRNHLQG
jgi:hypothetical protein